MPEPLRVLVVEDSYPSAELVRRRLVRGWHGPVTTRHAPSLAEGLEALDEPWDVVVLDLGLPGCTGLDALETVRARSRSVPVVVLTGQDDHGLALAAVEAEAQDYLLKKQLDEETLVRAIRHARGRQAILDRLARAVDDARASEARLRELTLRSADGIVVVDLERRVRFANPAAERLLGTTIGDVSSLDIHLDATELTVTIDEEPHVIDVRATDLIWHGEPARLCHVRDVTERKRSEELRVLLERNERLRALGQLSASVAHEINSLLTYVLLNLENAMQLVRHTDSVDHPVLERLERAFEGSQRVARIVKDLSAFTRVEPERPHAVDVHTPIRAALNMATPQLRHHAQVRVELDERLPPVTGSEGRLAQVLVNVLVNAAQAIPPGHVEEHEVLVRARAEANRVVVEVSDTGGGIAEADLRRIFDPFFTTKQDAGGSGLGLSICHNIVHGFGGTLEVESELGRGTTVPIGLVPHGGGTLLTKSIRPSSPSPRSVRVLLVDDERGIVDAMRGALGDRFEVCAAYSGNEACALVREAARGFGAIVCDLLMPDGTGMDFYRWLENARPELCSRVVFTSGGLATEEARAFVEAHPELVVSKPIDERQLVRTIERLVEEGTPGG